VVAAGPADGPADVHVLRRPHATSAATVAQFVPSHVAAVRTSLHARISLWNRSDLFRNCPVIRWPSARRTTGVRCVAAG